MSKRQSSSPATSSNQSSSSATCRRTAPATTRNQSPVVHPVSPQPPQQLPPVSPERRHRMVAEAAYYIAEKRRFSDGDPVSDWLEAEAFIDRVLSVAKGKRRLALQFLSAAGMEKVAAVLVEDGSH